jgi:ethanolamine utilization protein EutQ (cupin superfamily)
MSVPGVRWLSSDDADLRWYRRGSQQLRLADAVDGGAGAAMTVGFARYAAGEANEWIVSYDEALVVTKGSFAVESGGETTVAGVGEVIYLSNGTPVVYRAIDESEVVYVSYPHWHEATVRSPHAARLEEFVEE